MHLRFTRSFYVRHGLVCGFTTLVSLLIPLVMRHVGALVWLVPPLLIGPCVFLVLREIRIAARMVDEEGVTRGDGRRFLWKDLQKVQEVNWIYQNGRQGSLNHVDLLFTQGKARILYQFLENGWEAIQLARKKAQPKPEKCPICGDLQHYHLGMQKHGREGEDTFLPPACGKLKTVREGVVLPGEGKGDLEQCPECEAWFFYRSEYEYLAAGSEDSQILMRLSPEEFAKIQPPRK